MEKKSVEQCVFYVKQSAKINAIFISLFSKIYALQKALFSPLNAIFAPLYFKKTTALNSIINFV
jgi:hypothetical protein